MRAKKLLFLSHTLSTFNYAKGGMGEITNVTKLKRLLDSAHYSSSQVVDIYSLFGGIKGIYHSLAHLNYTLALAGESVLEETKLEEANAIAKQIESYKPDVCFILSLNWSVAALSSLGIQKKMPLVSKLYVHHENEKVPVPLFEPSTLLLTESLLASKKATQAGIPPWKIIYFPNHCPTEIKPLTPKKNAKIVIGIVSRLEYGKNIEYALDVVQQLIHEGEDITLLLKGHFDPDSFYPFYQEQLKAKIYALSKETWFTWDQSFTPFPEVLEQYSDIDILIHLSGAEAGSNIVAEFMGLKKTVIILDASVNPSLYNGGAVFVKSDGFVTEALLPFALPDKKDLYQKLKRVIKKKEQIKWAKKGREIAVSRFSPERTLKRIPLILEAAEAYFHDTSQKESLKQQITALYEEDRLSDWP